MTKIYVGNLPFDVMEDKLREMFSEYGNVETINLITDRETGRPRGFGFVEMSDGATNAIAALNDTELGGRNLKVNEARPRENRSQNRW